MKAVIGISLFFTLSLSQALRQHSGVTEQVNHFDGQDERIIYNYESRYTDDNDDWAYSNDVRNWSGRIQTQGSVQYTGDPCRKLTLRRYSLNKKYFADISVTKDCLCTFSCINKNKPVFPGDSSIMMKKTKQKWCPGQKIELNNLNDVKYRNEDGTMSVEQAKNTMRDFCTLATKCEGMCS